MTSTHDADYLAFCNRYESLFSGLVSMGWTHAEVYTRVTTLFPDINREHFETAMASDRWVFTGRQEQTLNNVMMAAALWYAVAITYDLEADPEYAAVHLDTVILQDLPRLLDSLGSTPEDISDIMGKLGAALKYLAKHPYTELHEAEYDDLLENLPAPAARVSGGTLEWPPTRAVIENRVGDRSWSVALLKTGICPPDAADQGISLSASSLTDRTFRNALGEFLNYCVRYDRKPTVMLYGHWAESTTRHYKAPHLGAIRAKYGSWHTALQEGRALINDALNLSSSAALPVRSTTHPDPTEPLNIDDITAQGIGIVQPKKLSTEEEAQKAWDGLTQVMQQRLEELPWSLSLHLYYISPAVAETGDYTNYASVLRSPAGYFCELTSASEFTSIDVTITDEVLAAAGWENPLSNGRWTKNFLSVGEAAQDIIAAMRYGMGCTQPDYYQSDDPANMQALEANPSTGSIPMVPVTGEGYVSIDSF